MLVTVEEGRAKVFALGLETGGPHAHGPLSPKPMSPLMRPGKQPQEHM